MVAGTGLLYRPELFEPLTDTPWHEGRVRDAIAALEDKAHLRETKRVIDEGRAYLQKQFAEMEIPFVPAAANFVMVNVGDACAVFQKLLQRKIIVRPLKGYGLPEWVRISVGTMEENRQLIAALRDIMRSH